MSADTNKNAKNKPQEPKEVLHNPEKVRSTRYEWEHDLPPEHRAEPRRPLKRSADKVSSWAQKYLDLARRAFDRDDDPDLNAPGNAAESA